TAIVMTSPRLSGVDATPAGPAPAIAAAMAPPHPARRGEHGTWWWSRRYPSVAACAAERCHARSDDQLSRDDRDLPAAHQCGEHYRGCLCDLARTERPSRNGPGGPSSRRRDRNGSRALTLSPSLLPAPPMITLGPERPG